jgi:ubiquinone/menaquinone biosynthesis C-methylase UbiE
MHDKKEILSIYDDEYAKKYETYYLQPWINKHNLNVFNIERILQEILFEKKRWLDICCGQGWHFSKFSPKIEKIGFDLSIPQLRMARKRNPDAVFIQADIFDVTFKNESFDIITSFWAAYSYLNSEVKIKKLINKAINWTKKGGAMYFEVLLPKDLESFNNSVYAKQTGFYLIPRKTDFSMWTYRDFGGIHNMRSPPLQLFLNMLTEHFTSVEAEHDSGFMTHVIAVGKQ